MLTQTLAPTEHQPDQNLGVAVELEAGLALVAEVTRIPQMVATTEVGGGGTEVVAEGRTLVHIHAAVVVLIRRLVQGQGPTRDLTAGPHLEVAVDTGRIHEAAILAIALDHTAPDLGHALLVIRELYSQSTIPHALIT